MPRKVPNMSEVRFALCHAVRKFNVPVARAAAEFGVSRKTARKWLDRSLAIRLATSARVGTLAVDDWAEPMCFEGTRLVAPWRQSVKTGRSLNARASLPEHRLDGTAAAFGKNWKSKGSL